MRDSLPVQTHFSIGGRRWRATDPRIPPAFQAELTRELMSARRAVKASKGTSQEHAARARVQDAKVALGERGPKWWLELTEGEQRVRITATIRALLRGRGAHKSICPSDVARASGDPHWRKLLPLVRAVAFELQAQGQICITQKSVACSPSTQGPIRLRLPQPE